MIGNCAGTLHSLCRADVSELILSFPAGDSVLQFPLYKGRRHSRQGPAAVC